MVSIADRRGPSALHNTARYSKFSTEAVTAGSVGQGVKNNEKILTIFGANFLEK